MHLNAMTASRKNRFCLTCSSKFRLASLQTNKLLETLVKFPQCLFFTIFLCEIRLVETMLKNIRCFIVFIVILVLGSYRKQGIVFSFFALEYEVEKI